MNTVSTQVSPSRAERVRVCLKKTNSPNPCNRLSREALACWYAASRLHFIPEFSSRGGLQIPRSNTPLPSSNVSSLEVALEAWYLANAAGYLNLAMVQSSSDRYASHRFSVMPHAVRHSSSLRCSQYLLCAIRCCALLYTGSDASAGSPIPPRLRGPMLILESIHSSHT